MTVLSASETTATTVKTFIIDAIKFKTKLSVTVGAVTRAPTILKVIETQTVLEKLKREFGCTMQNTVVEERRVETSDCNSTVLIRQDYRLRPANLGQMKIFAQAQKELLVRVVSRLNSSDQQRVLAQVIALTRASVSPQAATFAPKSTLRGQL